MGKKSGETTLVGTRLPNDIIAYIQQKVDIREYSSLSHGVIRLITLGIKYEQEKENRLLKKIFKRAPVAICITDPEGNIVMWNEQLVALTGYAGELLKGMNLSDLYIYQEKGLNLREALEERTHIKDIFVELRKQDGESLGILLSVESLPVRNDERYLITTQTIK